MSKKELTVLCFLLVAVGLIGGIELVLHFHPVLNPARAPQVGQVWEKTYPRDKDTSPWKRLPKVRVEETKREMNIYENIKQARKRAGSGAYNNLVFKRTRMKNEDILKHKLVEVKEPCEQGSQQE